MPISVVKNKPVSLLDVPINISVRETSFLPTISDNIDILVRVTTEHIYSSR